MVVQSSAPGELASDFVEIAHRVVWCSVATVDRANRPRSRVMHPVWERKGNDLVGWVTARRTPLKAAHLGHSPFVSCSYWDPRHDVAVADCEATWVSELGAIEHAWSVCRRAPAPVGHDPAQIWPDGPGSPEAGMLRLGPWRLRVGWATDLPAGRPPRSWRRLPRC